MKEAINFNDAILKPGFPLEGVHLVAASAGTGKTYSIQNIYARLVIEKGLRVSEIQVMTYTEAATKELRDRLRNVLIDINTRLNDKSCEGKNAEKRNKRADDLIAACSPTDETRQHAKKSVGLALLEFDNAAISTIHGFCHRALGRYAFDTHTPFNPEIEDNKISDLTMRALDWWRTRKRNTPPDLLSALSLTTLQKHVCALAGKADWKLDVPDTATPEGFMLQTAADIVDAYENDRINRSKQTFDDLLRAMRDALKGPFGKDFAAKLRDDFKAALIDEFQDTDPVQFDIFKLIFLASPQMPVFFVGDPKQAIYAFRGGDIFTYRTAAENYVPPERKYALDTNHRSTKRLMDAVNAIFMDRQEYTFGDSQINYPEKIKAGDDNPPPLRINGQDDSKPFQFIQVKGKQEILYNVLAQEIVNTLTMFRVSVSRDNGTTDEIPLSPKDIAILVSRKDTGANILEALKKVGIPCVIQNPGNVFAQSNGNYGNNSQSTPTRMLREIHAVLKAMANPSDGRQVRTALATSFFGVPPAELLDMNEDTLANWIGVFNDLNKSWLKRGLGAAVSQMQKCGIRHDIGYRQRLAALPDGERLLADCGQIFELAFAAIKDIGPSPDKLLDWLEERVIKADEEKDADAYARELESEHDAVRIMTMHVSKGLQFPVVFLPECNVKLKGAKPDDIFCYHNTNESNEFQLFFTTEDNPLVQKEELQEKLRLLYVAMTRAEQRTVVIYNGGANETLSKLMDNAVNNGAGNSENSPIEWLDNITPAEEPPQYTFHQPDIIWKDAETPRHFDLRSTNGSYSALSPSKDAKDDDGKDPDSDKGSLPQGTVAEAPPIFKIQAGSKIGSCWHEILEKIPFDADETAIRPVAETALLDYGFKPLEDVGGRNYLDITTEMITKTLDFSIPSLDGNMFSLREIHGNQRMSELEFSFPSAQAAETTQALSEVIRSHWNADDSKQDFLNVMANWNRPIPQGFINGFIDLFFQHGDCFYIVDWKSNILGGLPESITEESVRKEMAKHGYFFQYLLYAAVLHCYLKDVLGDKYNWEKNFGGIRYYFLRGVATGRQAAVFADKPSEGLLDDIAKTLGLEVK